MIIENSLRSIGILLIVSIASLFVGTKILKKDKLRPIQEEGARQASGNRARKRWDAVENLLLQAIV